MHCVSRRKFLECGGVIASITVLIFYYGADLSPEAQYINCYWLNAICLLISGSLFGLGFMRDKFDIFDPITSFFVIYALMFFVAPMHSIVQREYYAFNVDMFPYGIKGSIYALIGFISFFLTYTMKQRRTEIPFYYDKREAIVDRQIPASVFLFAGIGITLFANLFYFVKTSGNGLIYVLTFGLLGSGGREASAADLGFIGFLAFALPSFVLLYLEYGNNKPLALLFLAITFSLKITSGFRWNIVQMVVMFGSYYFLRTGKKMNIKAILLAMVLLTVPIFLMSLFRNSIRSGEGIDFTMVNSGVFSEVLEEALWSNLDIYKSYYSIISVVPEQTGYLFGGQIIFYTMIILIPRAIWRGKPGNPGTVAQGLALGQAAVLGGYAYPCLGEYYYDSGLVGIIFYTGLFGYLTSSWQNKYRYQAKTKMDFMIFSTILSQIIQFIIRGYMPTNFWRLLVSLAPYWAFKLFYLRKYSVPSVTKIDEVSLS